MTVTYCLSCLSVFLFVCCQLNLCYFLKSWEIDNNYAYNSIIMSFKTMSMPAHGGGGGNLPWFWVRMCGWSPRTPPHSYTRPSEKPWPIHILPISKIDPIHILFWKIDPIHIQFFKFYPFIYFSGEKDTPLIYFWCKNDTHSYTGRPEKYTPFQPHICIYLYNGSYPPPPPVCPPLWRRGSGLDRKIRVRFPAYPHRVWALWWQGGKRRLRTSRCPCRCRLGTLKTPSCPWRGCPPTGQNLETGHLSRHYIAEISLNVTLNHIQRQNNVDYSCNLYSGFYYVAVGYKLVVCQTCLDI